MERGMNILNFYSIVIYEVFEFLENTIKHSKITKIFLISFTIPIFVFQYMIDFADVIDTEILLDRTFLLREEVATGSHSTLTPKI